jgi:hypothetical protein
LTFHLLYRLVIQLDVFPLDAENNNRRLGTDRSIEKEIKEMLNMKNGRGENIGLEHILQRYKRIFRTPENFNYYSRQDFKTAERKFLKYALNNERYLNISLSKQ